MRGQFRGRSDWELVVSCNIYGGNSEYIVCAFIAVTACYLRIAGTTAEVVLLGKVLGISIGKHR